MAENSRRDPAGCFPYILSIKSIDKQMIAYYDVKRSFMTSKSNTRSSYPERWRDWPDETSATGSSEYCANSSKRFEAWKIRRGFQ
jgi:hypothetical protein